MTQQQASGHAMFEYTPDKDIHVHEEGAIKLICAAFQSHENGIPEWVKNSADEYARVNVPPGQRVVAVIIDSGSRDGSSSISVLDLAGMDSDVIENHFRVWADPDASAQGGTFSGVQGGHGNGGKCYMSMMFEDHALIHTVRDGLGCRYGVQAGSFLFGYIPDRDQGRRYDVPSAPEELESALRGVGLVVSNLPGDLQQSIHKCEGFTLVTGRGPKGSRQVPVVRLVDELRDHTQMIRSIDFCDVYIIANGQAVEGADPLALEPVKPDPAFAEPLEIPIPDILEDPRSGEAVSTTKDGTFEVGTLTLRTSDKSMRWSRKARHTIIFHAVSGYIGYREIRRLGIQSGFQDRIYGDCELHSLEGTKQNSREALADTPLTRVVEAFITEEIEKLAGAFEALQSRSVAQREKDELSRINEALDKWKNEFMTEFLGGLVGGHERGHPPPPPPLPSGIPARVDVAGSTARSGIGVSFRPSIRFYDESGRRIGPHPYNWVSEDTNVAWVDPDLRVINTFAKGNTRVWAETLDGKLTSNAVGIEVLNLREIRLEPEEIEIEVGSRRRITAVCRLSSGDLFRDVSLIWTEDDPTIARISAAGFVFAFQPGETKVTAGDDGCTAAEAVTVRVVEAHEGGGGNEKGRGYPRILISGYDDDPETDEVVNFSPDDPPVWQRPQDVDRHIWWINSSAPFARMYLDRDRGYGYNSREWRIYHIERYIDVMSQIAMASDPDIMILDIDSWLVLRGTRIAEIQAAAAESLEAFIADGELPEAP